MMRVMGHLRAAVLGLFVLTASARVSNAEVATATKPVAAKPATRALTSRQLKTLDAVEKHRVRLTAAASDATKAKLQPAVAKVQMRAAATLPPEERLDLLVDAKDAVYASFGKLPDSDIEALTYLVLMEASKSAREDLKSVMASVKAINDAKRCLRKKTCVGQVKARKDLSAAQIDVIVHAMTESKDALSELGETESLRLQMAMDRMSKLMSTLSNLQKKMADTSATVISNLK
jgi:hypothetical protein